MTLVAIADDPIVTNCPPSSIVLIRRPRMPMSRVTSAARASPDISSACMRAREAAVSAVSAPAKNAAKAMLTMMMAMSSEIGMEESLTRRPACGRGGRADQPGASSRSCLRKASTLASSTSRAMKALADPLRENECQPARARPSCPAAWRREWRRRPARARRCREFGSEGQRHLQMRLDPRRVLPGAEPEVAREAVGAGHPDGDPLAVDEAARNRSASGFRTHGRRCGRD